MLQPSRGKTFNQGSLNSNYVFRLLKVLLRSEWRQINPLFKAPNNFAYRKIPKISPGAYILQRPFLEGLIFGGTYIRRGLSTEGNLRFKLDWASLMVGSKFTVFALFYFAFEGNFPSTSPEGLIFGGAN